MLTLGNKLTLNSQPIYHFVNKYSIDFDGLDEVIVTDGADTVLQNTTYSFWCKSTTTSQNQGVFGHGGRQIGAFHINWLTDNVPLLNLGTDYYKIWADNPAQDDGDWHHWVVYLNTDITKCELYIDAILQTAISTVSSGSANAYTESLCIGGVQEVGGDYYEGNIDEFAVYDRELTQAEITRMYNTYYSPNRVSNGNFATIGNEEVTNGDFSQIGSEQVTNGDFATDSDWDLGSSWSISGGKANYDAVTTASELRQLMSSIAVGKTVKIQFDISDVEAGKNAYFKLECSGDPEAIFGYTTFSEGTYTYYHTIATAFNRLTFFPLNTGTGGYFSIDNVSVKEVLQDWEVSDYGGVAASASLSLDDGAVKILKTADSDWRSSFLRQTITYTDGSHYKVTFKIKDGDTTSASIYVRDVFDNSSQTIKSGISLTSSFVEHTYYFTANSNSVDISFGNVEWNNAGSGEYFFIDDVSVKEVGQGWSQAGTWNATNYVEFNGSSARLVTDGTGVGISQTCMVIGREYKLTFDVIAAASGSAKFDGAGINFSSVDSYSTTFTATQTGLSYYRNSGAADITIDNVVLQELKHDATNLMLNAAAYQSANPLITSTNSMEFDGADDYMEVQDSSDLQLEGQEATFTFWTKLDSLSGGDQKFLAKALTTGSASGGYQIRTSNDDLIFQFYSSSSWRTLTTSSFFTDITSWVNATITIDSSNLVKMYKNGVEVSSGDIGYSIPANSGELLFGARTPATPTNFLNGEMTEVGVFDRTLTALEVASLYNQGMPTNLLVNRNDYQSGNPTVFNTKQVDFDGTDDYLIANSTLGSMTGSLSFWVKLDTYGADVYLYDARGVGNTGSGYLYLSSATPSIATQSSGTVYVDGVTGANITTNEWHHIVVTGTTLDITTDIIFGSRYNEVNILDGQMSQVGLWNSTLTADEVSSLYNHGLPIDLTTDQAAYESSSNLVGYWRMGSGTLDEYPVIYDQTNATLGGDLVNTIENDAVSPFPTFIDNGGGSYTMATVSTAYSGFDQPISDAFAVVIGETYKLTFDFVLNSGVLDMQVFIGSDAVGGSYAPTYNCQEGSNTVYMTITTSNSSARFVSQINSVANMTISNIVLKKVQGNPAIMTNMTASDIENGSPYANVVQNGTFDTNVDNWSGDSGATVVWQSDSTALVTTTDDANFAARQDGILTSGVTYKTTFRFKPNNTGEFRVRLGGSSYQFISSDFVVDSWNEVEFTATADGSNIEIGSYTGNITNFYLDDVTATEVNTGLQGYWKMGDGTNDEYPYIFDQTNPTLGADTVVNGDFSDGTTGWVGNPETTLSVSNGQLDIQSTSGTGEYGAAFSANTFVLGKKYLIKLTVISCNNAAQIRVGTTSTATSVSNNIWNSGDIGVGSHQIVWTADGNYAYLAIGGRNDVTTLVIDNVSVQELADGNDNFALMTNMVEGNITNQYPLTKIRNYYRMGDGILDGYPIIQDQTSPNLAHIPTTNLITNSNSNGLNFTFDNVSMTYNSIVSPDGLTNGILLEQTGINSSNSAYNYSLTTVDGNYTYSIFIKAKDSTSVRLYQSSGSGVSQDFNPQTMSVGVLSGTLNLNFEDVGNGWFRVSFTRTLVSASTHRMSIYPDRHNTQKGLYIFGLQVEVQTQATAYLKSDGIASVRKATTTNLILYSEDFSEWTIDGSSSITSNATTSPIGTNNATKLIAGAVSGRQAITLNSSNSGDLVFSVYAKKSDYSFIQFSDGQDPSAYANFDLNTGVVGSSSVYTPTIINIGNGWYRCIATFDASLAINNVRIGLITSSTSVRVESFSGDGTSGVYIWGSQLEEQTQVETYAKTTGLPVTIDLFTENNYGTMTNMVAGDIVEDTP